jgi:hypothetical protein
MAIQQREHFVQMRLPYEDERAALFEEEPQYFSTALCTTEDWLGQKNTAFCKAVFASQEAATGLTLDRKLSTKASPTFSKVLAQHWKVSIPIDGKNLNQPFGGSSSNPDTGEIWHHGPWLDAWINIRPVKPFTEELEKRAMLGFEWIFPAPNSYHFMCRSRRELEATMRIFIKMFGLIEPELEAALVKESADRAP